MPSNIGNNHSEIVTPSGGIFPGATLLVCETSPGMGFDAKVPVMTSLSQLKFSENFKAINHESKDVTRQATFLLYKQHNLH